MRDGVKLFTSIYIPKDKSKTYPIILNRTPYSVAPYGADKVRLNLGPSPRFGKSGYIFVYQDVRGKWMSEGEFVNMRPQNPQKNGPNDIDESTDTYDTIDWLLKNVANHNGKVGQWGISYPGFYTAAGMIDAHPALVAASPQAPVTDWFAGDDFHHNGAFFLPHAFNFLAVFGKPRPAPTTVPGPRFDHGTPDGYAFFLELGPLPNADARYFKGSVKFWNELMDHPTYDEFWKARNLRAHLKNIRPAVLTVGGWFDAENLFGALQCYEAVEANHPERTNQLVMGPWYHGQWASGQGGSLGDVRFGSNTSEFYQTEIEFPFFEHHLKDAPNPNLPEAYVFETGANEWRKHATWPPAEAKTVPVFLSENGGLSVGKPPRQTEASSAFDEFISDPAKPVPVGSEIAIGMTREYMVDDQRQAARRPDVLVYQTPALDTPLTVAGPIDVELVVSTTGTDADWIVKVIDVYPADTRDPSPNPGRARLGQYQQLVRGDVMRGRFRDGLDQPTPFQPGKPTKVRIRLNDMYHTFLPGHRMMVQIQSSWFPLVDRNPQSFVDINHAQVADFQKATHRVYRSVENPSQFQIRVLERASQTRRAS
jgi:putative CocE/NonD family hydrolase